MATHAHQTEQYARSVLRGYPMIALAFIVVMSLIVACGEGDTRVNRNSIPLSKDEATLPEWAVESNLISTTDWSEETILGADGVRYEISMRAGYQFGIMQVRFDVVGSISEPPEHILASSADVHLSPVRTRVTRRENGTIEKGEWQFPGGTAAFESIGGAVFRLYR